MSKHTLILSSAALAVFSLAACGGDPDSPGIEYFPDMYRSPSVEAYVDYGQDPYYFEDSVVVGQRMTQSARKPVPGTIAFDNGPEQSRVQLPLPVPQYLGRL